MRASRSPPLAIPYHQGIGSFTLVIGGELRKSSNVSLVVFFLKLTISEKKWSPSSSCCCNDKYEVINSYLKVRLTNSQMRMRLRHLPVCNKCASGHEEGFQRLRSILVAISRDGNKPSYIWDEALDRVKYEFR